MNSKTNPLLSLVLALSLVLSVWPIGTQAETPTKQTTIESTAIQPAASALSAPTFQPLEPASKKDDAEKRVWEVWEALPPDVQVKVDPRILAELRGEVIPTHLGGDPHQAPGVSSEHKPLEKTRFLVHLRAQANLETIARQRFANKIERRQAVFDTLLNTAQATQGPVKALLSNRMSQGNVTSYQPFYVFNGFAVQGDLSTIVELAQRDDVERIVANYPLVLWGKNDRAPASSNGDLGGLNANNWNIDLVDAERVWKEFGVTGVGAVVGGIDTGVDWLHPALQGKYRGYNAGGPGLHVHDYNWFDPNDTLYPGGDLGPSRSPAPFDNGEHGTHTMGTMVGDGGTPGTQVGMAPGAEWIAISLNELSIAGSIGDDIIANKAFQWMLCPTDLSGALATADCSKAPDAVNNSWGSANPADDTFRPAIQALRAAGVAPVFASGNPSAGPGSIGAPANAPEAITVGATDINDDVASFSGRGPSFYTNEQKPELSAPGVNVNSAVPGGGYSGPTWSGTSMAAPHVAGLIALMVSADLQDGYRDFNVDELERFMAYTALDLGDPGPDDDYGFGRIDAYEAVRWVRSAGDLQGVVRDAGTSAPIDGAIITGVNTGSGDSFSIEAGVTGQYSVTVPAGNYDLTVQAWGYHGDTFPGQTVIAGALSIADFNLTALPTALLSGQVQSGSVPINGALVYVVDQPSVHVTTGADGAYTLALPLGTHEVAVEATGYRILRENVSVAGGGSSHNFSLTPAPTILLVEADTYAGWFMGWPVQRFFQQALDQKDYLYDLWRVEYTTFNDTQVLPDGSLGYGIPSTTTLGSYDLVIWAHGGSNWGTTGSTMRMGASDELMAFLDNGGRLIISGQDLGWSDDGTTFYDDYLHADYTMDTATSEGETVSGQGFLTGLDLEVTNASLRGYPNGATGLWPDAVTFEDGGAFSILDYDNGNGSAALAVDPCDAPYRAVYFALGYENIAPRADNHNPDIAEVMERSIDWVMGSRPTNGVTASLSPSHQTSPPGSAVVYDLSVTNQGSIETSFELSLAGNAWPTRILSGTAEISLTQVLLPCSLQELTLEVGIPATAEIGDQDTVTVTAARHPEGTPHHSADAVTLAFPQWQIETPMPTPRYRLAAAALANAIYYYAIAGWDVNDVSAANERYNACTGRWDVMAPMPNRLANVGAAALNGKIYVVGGYTRGEVFYDSVYVYDPATDAWSSATSLPAALAGVAVAGANGKLYAFGGGDADEHTDKTYAYDPGTDAWTEKAPMPGGARAYASAAELGGKIYVVGGWPNLNTVEVYDPDTDTWSTAASMNVGRQSSGLVAAPDGHLYVSGGGVGWLGLNSAERYDPQADAWEDIPSLHDAQRAGSASAYVAGRVFAVGGTDYYLSDVNESLRLADSFCLSHKSVQQSTLQPGDRITYTVQVYADPITLTNVHLADPIPPGTTFAGLGANSIGATYNSAANRVEWSGNIPANTDPLTFTFGVDAAASGWNFGDLVTNAVTFDDGAGLIFTDTAVSAISFPDPLPSTKQVNKNLALAGETLTYTIRVQNASSISDVFTLRDPIPDNATYVPGSLAFTPGSASYTPASDSINWSGVLPNFGDYVNTSGDYEWGDSDGNGSVPGVVFDWINISSSGTNAGSGDDAYYCDLPVGFTFDFYGTPETTFCASTNGFVSFDTSGYADLSNDCPLPSDLSNAAIVAGIWDDLVTEGGVYYQTFGAAPNRYLVVQWVNVRHYSDSIYFDFEIILYENGAIKVQMLDAGPELGLGSTTGIEDYTETQGLTYACDTADSLHDDLAVVFLPDGASWFGKVSSANVTFAVTTSAPLPVNTWITNTAIFTGSRNTVARSAATLINPVILDTSFKKADRTQAKIGDAINYKLFVENTGLLSATLSLSDPIPAHTTYVPGSLTYASGSGGYDPLVNVITWTGRLPDLGTYVNTSSDYVWGDSEGHGVVPGVTFDWIDISSSGTPLNLGDDAGAVIPIGFDFTLYGHTYPEPAPVQGELGVSSNGYLTFEPNYDSSPDLTDAGEDCPIVNSIDPNDTIAPFWNNLDASSGNVYYQLFGSAPNRYLVVQWDNVQILNTGTNATFETILYEGSSAIKFQYQSLNTGSSYVIGIENRDANAGLTYNTCGDSGVLYDGRAILFLPDGALWATTLSSANLTFAVTLDTPLPDLTPVTNTAYLDDGYGGLYDLQAAFAARSSALNNSFKTAAPIYAKPGKPITYTVYAYNSGAVPTTGKVRDELPPELTYEPGSLLCGAGSCGYVSGVITWTGAVAARSMVPVRFRASLPADANPGDLITNTAIVTDVTWTAGYAATATVMVIAPTFGTRLTPSADEKSGQAGQTVTYTLRVINVGDLTDSFALTASSTWTTELPSNVGPLATGAGENVEISVTIPQQAVVGTTATTIVTATSQSDATKFDSSTLTTRVIEAEPEPPHTIYLPLVFKNS